MKVNSEDMRHKILNAIEFNPNAANDDTLLITIIWNKEGWNSGMGLYENLRHVSNPETIRRTRQKLVEEGLVKPTERIVGYRYDDFKQARMSL